MSIVSSKLRALAVTTATHSPALPDIPSLGDFLPGYDASVWEGIGAPKNTPPEIVAKLNMEINAALVDPSIKARFADFGRATFATSPAGFGKFLVEEIEKWANVIRLASIKPE